MDAEKIAVAPEHCFIAKDHRQCNSDLIIPKLLDTYNSESFRARIEIEQVPIIRMP